VRTRQIKSKMAGGASWWHGSTGSPITTEVTQKITEKTVGPATQVHTHHMKVTVRGREGIEEFEANCAIAETLRRTQLNDTQMWT